MPEYVTLCRIDWHVGETDPALHGVIAKADDSLHDSDHTFETFERELEQVARANPALRAEALLEDGTRFQWLFRAADGEVSCVPVYADDLPLDEILGDGDDELALDADSEPELRDAASRIAARGIEGQMVVDVGPARYLVTIDERAVAVAKQTPLVDAALVARLFHSDFVPAPRAGRDPQARYDMALQLAGECADFVERVRGKRSREFALQYAWKMVRSRIARSSAADLAAAEAFGGPVCAQTVAFTGLVLDEIEQEAARLAMPVSKLLQVAVELAREDLETL